MRINKIKIAPMRIAAFILLVLAWSKGEVSGLVAWMLLLLILDISFEWTPRR